MPRNYLLDLMREQHHLLFVDTETTGIPVDVNRSYKDIDNWPSICQIAWLIYKKDGTIHRTYNYKTLNKLLITTSYSKSSSGPTSEQSAIELYEVLPIFVNGLIGSDAIIGHNIEYDVNVILCELYRLGLDTTELLNKPQFCTMKNGVEICGFETTQGERYPKLQELYTWLFHRPFDNAHDALYDISATAKCFWKILELNPFIAGDYPFLLDDKKKELLAKQYAKKAEESMKDGRLTPDSYKYYEKAADLGDLHSQNELAWSYAYNGVNKERAEQLFKLLLKRGDASAYFGLARLYPNEEEYYNKEWQEYCYKHFDELTEDDCRKYINAVLSGNNGFEKDLHKAIALCSRAIYNGYDFRRWLAGIFKQLGKDREFFETLSPIIEKDIQKHKGKNHYIGDQGPYGLFSYDDEYSDELCELIECYYYGKGTTKDLHKAWSLIEEATKWCSYIHQSTCSAFYFKGQYYELGLNGKEIELKDAFYYYNKCASYAPSALKLGIFYLNGYGCQKDKKKAKEHLLFAQKEGLDVDEYLKKANNWFF